MILKINPTNPEKDKIDQVMNVLQQGGVLVYPTDTIYGLGCDIFNKQAVKKIYQIKKRDPKKPMSIICSDIKDASAYALISDQAFRIMKKTLPGPYTYILQAKNNTPDTVISKQKTVGIRIPDNQICLELVKQLKNPIISTSLNLSGEQVLTNPEQLSKEMQNKIDLIIDTGDLDTEASTIIDLSGATPVIIRRGKGDTSLFE